MKRLLKRCTALFLVLLMALPHIGMVQAQTPNEIHVVIDGVPVVFEDQRPINVDGRILVPARGVFQALGFYVSWDRVTRQATLTRDADTLIITIDNARFTNNGTAHQLDVPAQLMGGRTMIPLRFPIESIGYSIGWNRHTRTVSIYTTGTQEAAAPTAPIVAPPPGTGATRAHFVYRSHVNVIHTPPVYTFRMSEDLTAVTITMENPCEQVLSLSAGDAFAFGITEANQAGMSGHVTSIEQRGNGVIITADLPYDPDDIFYEFEFSGAINMFATGAEIELSDYMVDMGFELHRNPNRRIMLMTPRAYDVGFLLAGQQDIGLSLSGTIEFEGIYIYHCLHRMRINHLYVQGSISSDINIGIGRALDKDIEIFKLIKPLKGFVNKTFRPGFNFNATGNVLVGMGMDARIAVGYDRSAGRNGFFFESEQNFTPPTMGALGDVTISFFIDAHLKAGLNLSTGTFFDSWLSFRLGGVRGMVGIIFELDLSPTRSCHRCLIFQISRFVRFKVLPDGVGTWLDNVAFYIGPHRNPLATRYFAELRFHDTCPHANGQDGTTPEAGGVSTPGAGDIAIRTLMPTEGFNRHNLIRIGTTSLHVGGAIRDNAITTPQATMIQPGRDVGITFNLGGAYTYLRFSSGQLVGTGAIADSHAYVDFYLDGTRMYFIRRRNVVDSARRNEIRTHEIYVRGVDELRIVFERRPMMAPAIVIFDLMLY